MPQQVLQQQEFGPGEIEGPPVTGDDPGAQIHDEIVEDEPFELGRGIEVGLPRGATAQQRPHPRKEFLDGERFAEVVVGTVVEGDDPVADRVPPGDHQDRHGGPGGTDAARGGEPVQLRHGDVHQHEVGCGGVVRYADQADQIEDGTPVSREDGLVPLESEQPTEPFAYVHVVVGKQDLPRHPNTVGRGAVVGLAGGYAWAGVREERRRKNVTRRA